LLTFVFSVPALAGMPSNTLIWIFLWNLNERMELDYRDFAEVSEEDAHHAVSAAQEFVSAIKKLTV